MGTSSVLHEVRVRFDRIGWSLAAMMAVVVLGTLTSGCQSMPTAPTNYQTFTITDLVVGTGTQAASGSVLTVYYTGWIYDASKADQKGAVFTSTLGTSSYTFTLGAGTVIEGWDEGLVGMRAGGKRRLVIPPSMAYGDTRSRSIPPN